MVLVTAKWQGISFVAGLEEGCEVAEWLLDVLSLGVVWLGYMLNRIRLQVTSNPKGIPERPNYHALTYKSLPPPTSPACPAKEHCPNYQIDTAISAALSRRPLTNSTWPCCRYRSLSRTAQKTLHSGFDGFGMSRTNSTASCRDVKGERQFSSMGAVVPFAALPAWSERLSGQ